MKNVNKFIERAETYIISGNYKWNPEYAHGIYSRYPSHKDASSLTVGEFFKAVFSLIEDLPGERLQFKVNNKLIDVIYTTECQCILKDAHTWGVILVLGEDCEADFVSDFAMEPLR